MASKSSGLSRRGVLKAAGAVAAAGGASALLYSGLAQQKAPAVLTGTQAGRKFRAYVKFSPDVPSVVELKALELTGRRVLIRTEAAQTCYTSVDQCLIPGPSLGLAMGTTPGSNGAVSRPVVDPTQKPTIVGHGGVGVVEAIGPQVVGIQVGDRVVISLHHACGKCFNCLRMRSDKCFGGNEEEKTPAAQMSDGTGIYSPTGAMSELTITNEEYVVPVFTSVGGPELAMLTCVGGCGLGMAMSQNVPVEVASDVVVFGAGPVGLSAVQGAKIKGASQVIVVEPIRYRRDIALKLGATAVVDPHQYNERKPKTGAAPGLGDRYDDSLVEHIRDMCKQKTSRSLAGGGRVGPDHVIEAVGGDRLKPKEVQGPDPTGLTVLQQCWDLCSSIGTETTCSVGQPESAMVQITAAQWADGAKHHWGGTGGGTNDRRDIPRFARLMETGQLNMKTLAAKTYPLSQAKEAYQVCADRTVVATVVTPNS